MESYNNTHFLSGDIGVSSDNSWLGKSLRFFESMWTQRANVNHAFVFISPLFVIEALTKITLSETSKYENRRVKIYRLSLTEKERFDLCVGLSEREDGAYGWDKYPLFFLDCVSTLVKRNIFRMKSPVFFFTKTFSISNIPVCSQLVVWGIHKFTSYRFKDNNGIEVSWKIVNPDYLDDLLTLPINNAILICEEKEKT